jgi:hypothetical protein
MRGTRAGNLNSPGLEQHCIKSWVGDSAQSLLALFRGKSQSDLPSAMPGFFWRLKGMEGAAAIGRHSPQGPAWWPQRKPGVQRVGLTSFAAAGVKRALGWKIKASSLPRILRIDRTTLYLLA